jgi:hypothetical protein
MAPIGVVYANTFNRSHLGVRVYETVIPRTLRLSEARSFGKTILEYDSSGTARGLIARLLKNSSTGRILRPLLATKREDESRKTAEDGLFFKFHSVFLGHATRWDVVEMN